MAAKGPRLEFCALPQTLSLPDAFALQLGVGGGPVEEKEGDDLGQVLPTVPAVEMAGIVHPRNPDELRTGEVFLKRADRIVGVACLELAFDPRRAHLWMLHKIPHRRDPRIKVLDRVFCFKRVAGANQPPHGM